MTLQQLLETLTNPDMLRIIKDEKDVYVGYLGLFKAEKGLLEQYGGQQVQRFRVVPEIRNKKWKELNLLSPMRPEETPDFSFHDLQMKLYHTIYL